MPAPQASMMQQIAKALFSANGIKVPTGWQQPQGKLGSQYGDSCQPSERNVPPDTAVPPLFQPASMNKYHVDVQKKLNQQFGAFIDGICSAICATWSQWQATAALTGVIINGPVAMGGQVVGSPWTPLILSTAPKSTPMQLKYATTIASVLGTAWLSYTSTIKVAGLPWYPAFAAFPSPVAPPTPNIPTPLAALTQVTTSVSSSALKGQMIGQHGDVSAPFCKELFDCIAGAFEKVFLTWQASTMVTNVLGTGPVPSFAPPFVPVGPVVSGAGNMPPGGFV